MLNELKELMSVIDRYEDKIDTERKAELESVFLWLAKYIETAYITETADKSMQELWAPLEAAFNIAISLFASIDKGDGGFDDSIAHELQKTKEKYLGWK